MLRRSKSTRYKAGVAIPWERKRTNYIYTRMKSMSSYFSIGIVYFDASRVFTCGFRPDNGASLCSDAVLGEASVQFWVSIILHESLFHQTRFSQIEPFIETRLCALRYQLRIFHYHYRGCAASIEAIGCVNIYRVRNILLLFASPLDDRKELSLRKEGIFGMGSSFARGVRSLVVAKVAGTVYAHVQSIRRANIVFARCIRDKIYLSQSTQRISTIR